MRNCLDHARNTLADYERLTAKQQDIEHEELAEATRRLVQLRDAIIAERRREKDWSQREQDDLDRVNALLSIASSAEFPLVGVRWKRLCMLRDSLRQLLEDWEKAPSASRDSRGAQSQGARP